LRPLIQAVHQESKAIAGELKRFKVRSDEEVNDELYTITGRPPNFDDEELDNEEDDEVLKALRTNGRRRRSRQAFMMRSRNSVIDEWQRDIITGDDLSEYNLDSYDDLEGFIANSDDDGGEIDGAEADVAVTKDAEDMEEEEDDY
jgi:seryl-tRNA synthetase